MDIKELVTLVASAILIVAYIAVAILAIKRKKAKGEPVEIDTIFKEIAENAMSFISKAEAAYGALTGATGVKTGEFKLETVLNKIRKECENKNVSFDEAYWTEFINGAVSNLINVNKKSAETPTETTAEVK